MILEELDREVKRTAEEFSRRRAAEAVSRQMESDITSLANSNDTLRFFQEAEVKRIKQEVIIAFSFSSSPPLCLNNPFC